MSVGRQFVFRAHSQQHARASCLKKSKLKELEKATRLALADARRKRAWLQKDLIHGEFRENVVAERQKRMLTLQITEQ